MTEMADAFRKYRRTQVAELRPYILGEKLPNKVSVSRADLAAGSPKPGDMIARNPKNHGDQWLVAAQYFADNFEPIDPPAATVAPVTVRIKMLLAMRRHAYEAFGESMAGTPEETLRYLYPHDADDALAEFGPICDEEGRWYALAATVEEGPTKVPKPTIGRIVHYTNLGDRDGKYPPEIQAAIVTRVHDDGAVGLHVFYPTGEFNMDRVEFTDADAGSDAARGMWTWPARTR